MFKLLELLALIRSHFGDLPLGMILEVLKRLASLGLPPDVDDGPAIRTWLRGLLPILSDLASLTRTDVDDKVAALLTAVVDDDEAWYAFHDLLTMVSDGRADVSAVSQDTLAAKVGFDPAIIMLIVKTILDVLRLLRKGE